MLKKELILHLFFIIFISPIVSSNIIINEIMANPLYDEDLNEWVELYNNGSTPIDVRGWIIKDNANQDIIEGGLYGGAGTVIPPYSYAIITDDSTRVYNNFNISQDAIKLYVDDSSIGNGLNNNGETLALYDNETNKIHEINYSQTDDGYSWAYFGNIWDEALVTPGYSNNDSSISIGCDWKVEIILNKTIFTDEFEWKVYVSKVRGTEKNNLTLYREIRDAYENLVKDYGPLKIVDALDHRTYTYTPNLRSNNAYIINANIISEICEDINLKNNYDNETFFLQSAYPQKESNIKINKVYDVGQDKKAKWGQTIRVRLDIYKGDTTKTSIKTWVQDDKDKVTKQSRVNVYTEYTNYNLTIPLQLDPNCNKKYKDGTYTIYAEGLDSEDRSNIVIEGLTKSLCEEVKVENSTKKKSTKETSKNSTEKSSKKEEQIKFYSSPNEESNKITGSVIYESSDVKAKNTGLYFFSVILVILVIYFILKK